MKNSTRGTLEWVWAVVAGVPIGLGFMIVLAGIDRPETATPPPPPGEMSEFVGVPSAPADDVHEGVVVDPGAPSDLTPPGLGGDATDQAAVDLAPLDLAPLDRAPTRPAAPESLAPYILDVVADLAREKSGLGYNLSHFYTEDLSYGGQIIPSRGESETMCVAAVAEVMVRAIDAWATDNNRPDVFEALPSTRFTRGSIFNLRPWLYMWDLERTIPALDRRFGAGAHSAMILFGLGQGVSFEDAQPGDFVTFNRMNGSGHAAIFLGFLEADYQPAAQFGPDVVGFEYFSAQSSGVSGLDYRHAYFEGHCPARRPEGIRRDCNLIKSDRASLFSIGRLYTPDHWRTEDSRFFITGLFEQGWTFEEIAEQRYRGEPKTLQPRSFEELEPYTEELEGGVPAFLSGRTTD